MRFRLILLAILGLSAGTVFAQPPAERFSGRTISSVRLFVERVPTADAGLSELVETRAGEPLLMAAVRETINHLFSLGRFQDIQVEAVDAPDGGVALLYNLIPIRAVERIEFAGDLGLSEGLLERTVEERFGRTPQSGRAGEVTRVLERLYEDHGYFERSIRVSSTDLDDPPRTILTYEVDSGPQARIGEIVVEGDPPGRREALLNRLRVGPGRPYDRTELDRRLAEYTASLRDRGHLQATATHRVAVSADGRVADVTLDVLPGPLVSITFSGDPLPGDVRRELVPLEREGSVDEDLLEDSVQRIREHLRRQGYWRADVTLEREEQDGRLTLNFDIRRGPLYRVAADGVEITGNTSIRNEQILPLVLLAPGDPYVSAALTAAQGAILRLYRTSGFAWAQVDIAEHEVGAGDAVVKPVIVVKEGPRALIGQIRVTGVEAMTEAQILRLLKLAPGLPYYEPTVRANRDAIELAYRDLGHASVNVDVRPEISDERARVDLTFAVDEGPQTLVDHIIIVGNRRIEEEVIRRELALRPGEPLGLQAVIESRRRLSQLGLFRRIDIRELEHGPATRRDVLVTVEEAPATTVGYGGGLEFTSRLRASGPGGEAEERLELAPRGFFEIGRRNLGGKNRSVNLFTRVSVRPQDAPDDPDEDGRGFGFSEYRVVGTFREPRMLDSAADLTLTGAVEQGVRSSFNFARKGVTAELVRRLGAAVRTSARYSFNTTRTFDERLSDSEQAAIDRLFPQVRLSSFSAVILHDTRDDVVEPTAGTVFSAESSVAARSLGGQVGFVKTFFQGLYFRQLPGPRGLVLASRAAAGLADGFPQEALGPDGRPIEDLPASERFFAGGDTTIRGFALDSVGVPQTISQRGFPRGGNAVVILNGELRVPVWKDLGAAVFADGGNVFERVTDLDFGELRGSLGFGVRYRSPIGPVRVDMGFKLDRREFVGGRLEPRHVIHFSIGQAF